MDERSKRASSLTT